MAFINLKQQYYSNNIGVLEYKFTNEITRTATFWVMFSVIWYLTVFLFVLRIQFIPFINKWYKVLTLLMVTWKLYIFAIAIYLIINKWSQYVILFYVITVILKDWVFICNFSNTCSLTYYWLSLIQNLSMNIFVQCKIWIIFQCIATIVPEQFYY